MKTIGNIIKEVRINKNYSKEKLGDLTHIKTYFITAIEKGDWENLPEFTVTLGFIKSIAHFLDIPENLAISTFRRDFPPHLIPKVVQKNKKEVFTKKFSWGPRMTFLVGVVAIILIVLGYLGFQYRKFNQPPALDVTSPTQNEIIKVIPFTVKGKTDPDATILVNDQEVTVDTSGYFSTLIDLSKKTTEIKVTAKSRSGKVTVVSRTIKVQP